MSEQELIDNGYKDGKKSFEVLARQIHDNFKWKEVHKAMKALNWFWYFGKDSLGKDNMGIPSLQTLKNHAYVLLKHAYDTGEQTGSGGFTAGWEDEELYLVFTLTEYSV